MWLCFQVRYPSNFVTVVSVCHASFLPLASVLCQQKGIQTNGCTYSSEAMTKFWWNETQSKQSWTCMWYAHLRYPKILVEDHLWKIDHHKRLKKHSQSQGRENMWALLHSKSILTCHNQSSKTHTSLLLLTCNLLLQMRLGMPNCLNVTKN